MFLKWTGGLLILFAGSGMGVWLAWGYKKRLSTLENLRRMIYCLKGEIVYSHAPLEEAFERIGKREKGVLGGDTIETETHKGQGFLSIIGSFGAPHCTTGSHQIWPKFGGQRDGGSAFGN